MSKARRYKFSIEGQPLYPYIKLTAERFPRLLSTRLVDESDGAEYFGPFLTRSGARILIDFLNTTFRLRSCTIPVDGRFPVPCTQFYAKRCLAPCVEQLCQRPAYLQVVELAKLFLVNERDRFESRLFGMISEASEALNFEPAAWLRDVMNNVREFWTTDRRDVWLADSADTYVLEYDADVIKVFIVTTRRGRVLGSRVFVFQAFDDTDPGEVLADVIEQFYPIDAPREIRVPLDLRRRHEVSQILSARVGRNVRIVVRGERPERYTALLALARTKLDVELERIKPVISSQKIKAELKKLFRLKRLPSKIEAFDAAHISGSYSTAAMAVWKNGDFVTEEYSEDLSTQTGEIATLRDFISRRFADTSRQPPDLILVDGGRSQLNAALAAVSSNGITEIETIGAVKPAGRHNEISHFLTADGMRIEFDAASPAMLLLQVLRDEAHDLANAAHRKSRDMAHFYESFGVPPLIVPTRLDDPNGKAGDLRPIKATRTSPRNQQFHRTNRK